MGEQPAFLTTDEAADVLRVSTKTVRRWIHSGRLRASKPGRAWRIRPEDILSDSPTTDRPIQDRPIGDDGRPDVVVYLDDNGSNPIDPTVREAVVDALCSPPANASSSHVNGVAARGRVDIARERLAELVGATAAEVVFTAGATEANNLILRGFPYGQRRTIIVSATEHDSIIRPVDALRARRLVVRVAPVTAAGAVDVAAFDDLLDDTVALVSVAAANSETGVLNPIASIADRAHAVGAAVHTDATQIVGRLPFSMRDVDALSLSGHKMCGPQGVGALIVRRRLRRQLLPIIDGGGHEGGLRSGSINVAGVVGLGVAADLAARADVADRMRTRRDRLAEAFIEAGGIVNGDVDHRLPNTVNVRFPGAVGDAVLARTPQVAASLGSACHAGALEPSATLIAMGLDRTAAQESIRFSVTRFTTVADIDAAAAAIIESVDHIRRLAGRVA